MKSSTDFRDVHCEVVTHCEGCTVHCKKGCACVYVQGQDVYTDQGSTVQYITVVL